MKATLVGLAVVALAAGGYWLVRREPAPESTADASLPSAAGETDAVAVGLGAVDVEGGATPLALPLAGPVEEVLAKEGANVLAGQPLVRLHSAKAAAQVAKAEAAVAEAKTRLARSRRAPDEHRLKVERQRLALAAAKKQRSAVEREAAQQQRLVRDETGSTDRLNAARDQTDAAVATEAAESLKARELDLEDPADTVALAEAALKAADADLLAARAFLQDHTLTAPRDGVVLRVLVSVGQMAGTTPAVPALWFRPAEPLVLRCEIDQAFATRVAVGTAVEVFDDNRQRRLGAGKVVRTAPWIAQRRSQLDEPFQRNDVRTLECLVRPDADDGQWRIGQRVRIVVPLSGSR